MTAKLTQEKLKSLLHYEPDTGVFTWRNDRSPKTLAGDIAGGDVMGYIGISIDGRRYQAHRLAWLYVHGSWPDDQLDHINRNRKDNRIANLRQANTSQNKMNSTASARSKSGHRGVHWCKRDKKWIAKCTVNQSTKRIGGYNSLEDAVAAYTAYAKEAFGEFYIGCTTNKPNPFVP